MKADSSEWFKFINLRKILYSVPFPSACSTINDIQFLHDYSSIAQRRNIIHAHYDGKRKYQLRLATGSVETGQTGDFVQQGGH